MFQTVQRSTGRSELDHGAKRHPSRESLAALGLHRPPRAHRPGSAGTNEPASPIQPRLPCLPMPDPVRLCPPRPLCGGLWIYVSACYARSRHSQGGSGRNFGGPRVSTGASARACAGLVRTATPVPSAQPIRSTGGRAVSGPPVRALAIQRHQLTRVPRPV
jgi:hypothetical protein